jgi:hypothetical protein
MEEGTSMQEDTMNEAAEVRRFRAGLIGNADESAGWRYRKAREFPWDARNVESAKSLRRLRAALSELSPDDELWGRYAAVWSRATEEDCPRLVEIEHKKLRFYGFSIHGSSGRAEKFLLELVSALELEALAPRFDRSPAEPPLGSTVGRSP